MHSWSCETGRCWTTTVDVRHHWALSSLAISNRHPDTHCTSGTKTATTTNMKMWIFMKCEVQLASHWLGCGAQVALKYLIHPQFSRRAIVTRKLGQSDLVLVCNHGWLVGLCTQDYKSLCAAVTICAALVNIQTHRHTGTQTDSIWPA